MAVVIYLQKVITVRHTADLHLAGQPHPCHGQASVSEVMQNDGLITIQVSLAHMKNRLC